MRRATEQMTDVPPKGHDLKAPHDIGRLPTGLLEENSLRGITAEQWKNYAIIYARS